jgi:hypothetical protein
MEIVVHYEKDDLKNNTVLLAEKKTVKFTSDKEADQWISWMRRLGDNKYKNFKKRRIA